MIDLDKYYNNISAYKLIEIIESTNGYKPEVIEYCKKRITELNLQPEVIKTHARDVIKKRFYKYFTDGKYKIESPIIIDSFYLNKSEVKKCFHESKSEYIRVWDIMTKNLPT